MSFLSIPLLLINFEIIRLLSENLELPKDAIINLPLIEP